jgi:hypothetical protein
VSRIPLHWWAPAFCVAFFATGIPYWQIPYATLSLPDSLIGVGLLVVSVVAAVTRAFAKSRLLPVIFVVGAAVPCAVFARPIHLPRTHVSLPAGDKNRSSIPTKFPLTTGFRMGMV